MAEWPPPALPTPEAIAPHNGEQTANAVIENDTPSAPGRRVSAPNPADGCANVKVKLSLFDHALARALTTSVNRSARGESKRSD
jgi:hypothetical protein